MGNTLITIAAGFTTGYAARKNITSTDIREYNRIYFWIRSDVTASAGDLKFRWEDANASTAFSGDVGSVDIPALAINTWTLVSLTIDPKRSSARDDAAVQALGIFVNTDLGPQNIRLQLDATREDPSLTVTVRIRGTAARPEITLVSSPSLPNDEVLAKVLFERSASQL